MLFVVSGKFPLYACKISSKHTLIAMNTRKSESQRCFPVENVFMSVVPLLKQIVSLFTRKLQNYGDVFVESYE